MKYIVKNRKTEAIVYETYSEVDAEEAMEYEFDSDSHYVIEIYPCRGCGADSDEKYDAYGISTGRWCDTCYTSPKYPYRKDRYDYEAYGERLDDNY